MKTGQVIKMLRRKKRLTQKVAIFGIPNFGVPGLSKFESGTQELSEDKFKILCQNLGVSPSDIYAIAESSNTEKSTDEKLDVLLSRTGSESERSTNLGEFEVWDSKTPLNDDDVELPFYQEVELSAGIGSEVVREDNGFKLRFSKSSLRKASVDPLNAACVQIKGDSMEPILSDGSTVGIDTSKTSIVDGKMYAIDHAGMLRVKVLHRIPGGLRVRSFNSDEYPDETYKGEELNDIKVIGKVFWSAAFHF